MRYVQPSIIVFCLALIASLGVHLPIYSALGVLAEVMLETGHKAISRNITFEAIDMDGDGEPSDEPSSGDEEEEENEYKEQTKEKDEPAKLKLTDLEKRTREPAQERKKRKPMRLHLIESPPKPEKKAVIQPELENKHAIRQRSEDPNVPPPENSRFIAKENRRVEEETVAIVRNLHVDGEDQSASTGEGEKTGEKGDSEKFEEADLMDREGSEERFPTELEAQMANKHPSQPSAGELFAKAVPGAPVSGATQPNHQKSREEMAGSKLSGGQEQALVIEDGMGTFRIPSERLGVGPGDQGGELRKGSTAEDQGHRKGSRRRGSGNNLQLSWSQFEATYGAEELKRQRENYLKQRRSKARGFGSTHWKKFKAAIENYVSDVKPGNQTALNAAASPFADYISAVHRRIHREFAYRFLRNLPMVSGPYSDPTLHTTLEIVFNRDGSIHKIGVVRSSGFLPFDLGAFEAVMRAQPYPEPPSQILSGDSRVYVHWGFHRNHRQCGTFNVKPFILPNPKDSPAPSMGPFKDPLGS